jgi:hypothetical protein
MKLGKFGLLSALKGDSPTKAPNRSLAMSLALSTAMKLTFSMQSPLLELKQTESLAISPAMEPEP